jgi:protein TonB
MLDQGMFADSMVEVSWAQRTRRSWTTLTSFALQAVVLGSLLLMPLLRTVSLPDVRILPTPLSWGAPPPPASPPQRHRTVTVVQSNLNNGVLIAPREIPHQIAQIDESSAPPQVPYDGIGVEGSTGTGPRDGVWRSLTDPSSRSVLPPPPPPAPSVRQFRTSHMLEGNLVHRVDPVYPTIARTARVQGQVVLSAVIGKDGSIQNLRVISGHPMLVGAAVEAVRQWRYRPYILNGDAIEVETQITVNFHLE